MIHKHQYVANDFSEDDTVWKYFSLPAFLALLEDRMLYFTKADSFADPNEFPVTEKDASAFHMSFEKYKESVGQIKARSYINCWRLSDYESFGMWNAYSDAATGVAIKTNVKSLFASFDVMQPDIPTITAGKVLYIDSLKEMTQKPSGPLNYFFIVFAKTKPYQSESELRLCFEDTKKAFGLKENIGVSVDLSTLIKEIYVGSSSKPYVQDLMKKILKRYDIDAQVKKSNVM